MKIITFFTIFGDPPRTRFWTPFQKSQTLQKYNKNNKQELKIKY